MSRSVMGVDVRRPEAQRAVIEPSKAWMLGIVVEADGTLRPSPTATLAFGPARRPEDREPLTCTCPDYCEIEHDAI